MKTLWLDLETTGLNPINDKIIEIALILKEANHEDKVLHTYVKHEEYPEEFVTGISRSSEITGITIDFLEKNGCTELRMFQAVKWFFEQNVDKFNFVDKFILCGYNIDFDDNFLRQLFLKYGETYYGSYICNARLNVMSTIAQAISQDKMPLLKSFKLQEVAKFFKVNDNYNAHSAIEDIKISYYIQSKLEGLLSK